MKRVRKNMDYDEIRDSGVMSLLKQGPSYVTEDIKSKGLLPETDSSY